MVLGPQKQNISFSSPSANYQCPSVPAGLGVPWSIIKDPHHLCQAHTSLLLLGKKNRTLKSHRNRFRNSHFPTTIVSWINQHNSNPASAKEHYGHPLALQWTCFLIIFALVPWFLQSFSLYSLSELVHFVYHLCFCVKPTKYKRHLIETWFNFFFLWQVFIEIQCGNRSIKYFSSHGIFWRWIDIIVNSRIRN